MHRTGDSGDIAGLKCRVLTPMILGSVVAMVLNDMKLQHKTAASKIQTQPNCNRKITFL